MSIYLNANDADEDREFTDDQIAEALEAARQAVDDGASYVCFEYYKDED